MHLRTNDINIVREERLLMKIGRAAIHVSRGRVVVVTGSNAFRSFPWQVHDGVNRVVRRLRAFVIIGVHYEGTILDIVLQDLTTLADKLSCICWMSVELKIASSKRGRRISIVGSRLPVVTRQDLLCDCRKWVQAEDTRNRRCE